MYVWCPPHMYVHRLIHIHSVSCGLQQTPTAHLGEEVITEGNVVSHDT